MRKLLPLLTTVLIACNVVPQKVAMDDSRIQPLLKAAASFERTKYGFTPIPTNATVRWESKPTGRYDAMLHIESRTSRTISFRKKGNAYLWTGEQEIFKGPKEYRTVDGTFNEEIWLTYEIEQGSGYPLNTLNVDYSGEDPPLAKPLHLASRDVQPILKEWGY